MKKITVLLTLTFAFQANAKDCPNQDYHQGFFNGYAVSHVVDYQKNLEKSDLSKEEKERKVKISDEALKCLTSVEYREFCNMDYKKFNEFYNGRLLACNYKAAYKFKNEVKK